MHEAVRCTTVINAPGLKLEAADQISESEIFATTSDGTLLSLKPDPRNTSLPWQVVNAVKSFSRKPITRLHHLPKQGYVLTQADDGVGLFSLSNVSKDGFSLVGKTKYPTCFCVNKQETLLCVCTKKKLLIFQWFEGEFTELQEFSISEPIKQVAWCGEYLLVAQKKDYQLFNLSSGSYTEVIPTGKSSSAPKILQLPYNELLLLKDSVGVFVGLDGKLTRKFGITWSEHPPQVSVMAPYAIAVFDKFVEVRSLHRESSYSVVQTISINGANFISHANAVEGCLLLGTQSSIFMLTNVPLLEQITELGKSGEYEEALRLCDSISDEDDVWRLTKSSLHQRYGWSLFAKRIYTEAIRHFSLSSKSPRHVLRLYPCILPEGARVSVQSLPKLVDLSACKDLDPESMSDLPAFKALLPYLQQQRRNLMDFSRDRRNSFGVLENTDGLIEDAVDQGWGGIDLNQLVDTGILHCLIILRQWDQLLAFLQQKNSVDTAEAERVLNKTGHYVELVLLYRQLGRHHEALEMLQSLMTRPDSFEVPPHESTINNLKGTNASIEYLLYLDRQFDDLVLDHSKWIIEYDPQGALRIFTYRYPSLDPGRVLPYLMDYGPGLQIQYLEFLISKKDGDAKRLQEKLAILLLDEVVTELKKGGDGGGPNSSSSLNGEEKKNSSRQKIAEYRQRIQELLSTSESISPEWMLSQLPETEMLEERALILRRLGKHREALGIYVNELKDKEMALEYCKEVYESAVVTNKRLLSGDSTTTTTTTTTSNANAGAPDHKPVLERDMNVYLDLVQILLAEYAANGVEPSRGGNENEADEKGSSPNENEQQLKEAANDNDPLGKVLDLMVESCEKIDPVAVLDYLPGDVPLSRVIAYIKSSFSHNIQERKKMSILKSLTKQEALQVRSELIGQQKQSVVVHPESVCRVCYKRIQNSVFILDNDGRLVHFVCHRRMAAQQQNNNQKLSPGVGK
jgi:tetratricopeptide (TPR) repeat protein